jgi:hypothetical protein
MFSVTYKPNYYIIFRRRLGVTTCRATSQDFSTRLVIAEAHDRSRARPRGKQRWTKCHWESLFRVLLFSPVRAVPKMLHARFNLTSTLMRRTSGRSLGTLKKQQSCEYRSTLEIKVLSFCFSQA